MVALLVALIGFGGSAAEQVDEDDVLLSGYDIQENEVARDAENPLSDKISVPVQSNFNIGAGPGEDFEYYLRFQPLVSRPLSDDLSLVSKLVVPVIWQAEMIPGEGRTFGLGDINYTALFTLRGRRRSHWALGPTINFPTATSNSLGSDKWSAGPAVAALAIRPPWMGAVVAQNLWSFAGDSDRRDVNTMLLQLIGFYNMRNGWYFVSAPLITANWEADSDNRWLVPIGGGIGRAFGLGSQPVAARFQAFYHVERPEGAPEWTLQIQFWLLFPKR
jgi:hypothetical protein